MKLIVIGGGPAGLNAALQARKLHAEVTCTKTTLFYPWRGIAFSCIFDYSHSYEEIREARLLAQEIQSQLTGSNFEKF